MATAHLEQQGQQQQQQQQSSWSDDDDDKNNIPDMKLEDITSGLNDRGIPEALFIDDVGTFAADKGASAELLIGAYSQLHQKYKTSELRLQYKSACLCLFVYCLFVLFVEPCGVALC